MTLIPVHDNNYKLVIYSQWTRYHWAPRPLQLTHLEFFNDAIKSIIILWPKNTYPYHLSHNPADKMTTYETRCPRTSSFHSYFSTSASKHPVCLPTIQGTKKKKFLQSTVPVKPTITPHYHWYIYEEPDLLSTVIQIFVADDYSKSSNLGIEWIF